MPSGDAQRAWFPEMLTELERFWSNAPEWDETIVFCERMTSLRSEIRNQRDIRPPMMMCRSCGKKHAMDVLPVSPRSLLFALQKIDAISDEELKRLDKEWMRYRKTENLDAQGHKNADGAAEKTHTSACH